MAPCANAAVIRVLLGCQNWIPHLRAVDFCHVHKSTQSVAAYNYASSTRASLELEDLQVLLPLLCCKVPVCLSSTCACGALRPLSASVNSNSERCAGRLSLVALYRTATHGNVCKPYSCAYSDVFLSRGTHAERDL